MSELSIHLQYIIYVPTYVAFFHYAYQIETIWKSVLGLNKVQLELSWRPCCNNICKLIVQGVINGLNHEQCAVWWFLRKNVERSRWNEIKSPEFKTGSAKWRNRDLIEGDVRSTPHWIGDIPWGWLRGKNESKFTPREPGCRETGTPWINDAFFVCEICLTPVSHLSTFALLNQLYGLVHSYFSTTARSEYLKYH